MRFLSRSRWTAFIVAGLMVGCIGLIDTLTGYEISLGFFYAAPVKRSGKGKIRQVVVDQSKRD